MVKDLTHGGQLSIDREIPPNAVMIGGRVFYVDFDLMTLSEEHKAREYARNPVFFAPDKTIVLY